MSEETATEGRSGVGTAGFWQTGLGFLTNIRMKHLGETREEAEIWTQNTKMSHYGSYWKNKKARLIWKWRMSRRSMRMTMVHPSPNGRTFVRNSKRLIHARDIIFSRGSNWLQLTSTLRMRTERKISVSIWKQLVNGRQPTRNCHRADRAFISSIGMTATRANLKGYSQKASRLKSRVRTVQSTAFR